MENIKNTITKGTLKLTLDQILNGEQQIINNYVLRPAIGSNEKFILFTKLGNATTKEKTFDTIELFNKQYATCVKWGLKNTKDIEIKAIVTKSETEIVRKDTSDAFTFTKQNMEMFGNEMRDLLKGLADKYGVKYNGANITYDEGTLKTNVSFSSNNYDAINNQFGHIVELFHKLPNDIFGRSFNHQGEILTVVNYKRANRKAPFILESSNGKTYKTNGDFIKNLLK